MPAVDEVEASFDQVDPRVAERDEALELDQVTGDASVIMTMSLGRGGEADPHEPARSPMALRKCALGAAPSSGPRMPFPMTSPMMMSSTRSW